jgi:pimeloyl-ACP methyl ester carboxylesterase
MTTDHTTPIECAWDIDGLRLTGLEWGPADGVPVLALHGWMDHGDSFAELAPRLTGCRVIALDLSGQGHSAHRAAHATYNIWDDLPQIAGVLDQLGWDRCVMLGHSRGANISALFAAALPERVSAFIALDSIATEPTGDDVVTTLRAFITQTRMQLDRSSGRRFDGMEDYIARRARQGNSTATATALAPRAVTVDGDAVRLNADMRLFASSAMKLTEEDVNAVLHAIKCPVLNIWAKDGIKAHRPKLQALAARAADLIANYEAVELPGDHHFHMDADVAAQIAPVIDAFLTRHAIA